MDYKQKYLKYKNKYLDLKGGMGRRMMLKPSRSSGKSNTSSSYSSDILADNKKVSNVMMNLSKNLTNLTKIDEDITKKNKEYIKMLYVDVRSSSLEMNGYLFLYKIYLNLLGLDTGFNKRNKEIKNLNDYEESMENLKHNFPESEPEPENPNIGEFITFKSLDDTLYNDLKKYIKPEINIENNKEDYDKLLKQVLFNLINEIVEYNFKYIYMFNEFMHEYFKDFDSYFKFIKNFMKLIIELDNEKYRFKQENKLLIEFTDYLNNNDGEIINNEVYKKILNIEEYDPKKKTLFIYIIKTINLNYFKYFYKEFVLHIFNKDILNDKEKINCIENIIYHLRIINHHENNENIVKMFEYMYMETQYQEEIINTIIRNDLTEPFLKKILKLHKDEVKKIDNPPPVHYLINVHKDNFNQYFDNFKDSFNNNDIIEIKNKNILVHILKFDDKDILKNFLAFMKDKLTEENEFHNYLFEKDIEGENAFDYCTKNNLNNSRQELNKFSSTTERLGNYLFKNGGSQEYESF